jgi:hypothetical protein
MSTEKQNALVLPEFVQISFNERGIEIVNEGDIIVRAKFPNATIRSLSGDVYIFSSNEKQVLACVEAPKGLVKIVGDDFEIIEIRAKEVFADAKSLQTKTVRSDGEITFNRGRLQANAISAHSLHFSGTDFSGQHVGTQEDAHFSGDNVQIQVVTGTHVDFQLRGTAKVGKLTAHSEAYLAAKQVDIDYLSAKNLRVTPQTQGVIVCLDGPAPSEPNSIVGMLSPMTFLEKIPALTGLIRELQSSKSQDKLLHSSTEASELKFSILEEKSSINNVSEAKANLSEIEIKTSEAVAEIREQDKSAMLEKPPEFYRTSAEIPIPYKELAAKQQLLKTPVNRGEIKEEDTVTATNIPAFEPDLSPSGPIFEPDLAPSKPLFELPSLTSFVEPVFDPNDSKGFSPKQEMGQEKQETKQGEIPNIFEAPLLPLEFPPAEEDPITGNTGPFSITNSGPIDLGLGSEKNK